MKRLGRLALAVVAGGLLLGWCMQGLAQASPPFPNCRLGAAVVNNPIGVYDYDDLNLGGYINYATSASPSEPGGTEFIQTVRVHQNKCGWCPWCRDCYTTPYSYTMSPGADTLRARVLANPGSTWFIGNEPDRRDWYGGGQDEIVPELYAQAYYEISQMVRQADPTAKLGIGGVVEGTPLRLKYLDRVWDEYQARYGRRLGDDVDIWNVHGFVLREEKDNWGAEIPAGLDDIYGLLIGPDDNDRLDLFQQQVIRFRQWMHARGERDKPLYMTEYGINMPEYYVSTSEVKAFMSGAFDFLLNYKDSNIGFPADDNRLVQRFMWYSLDDSKDSYSRMEDYAEALFSSRTYNRLEYGDHWVTYVQNPTHVEAHQPQINLHLKLSTSPISVYDPTGTGSYTFTLRAQVANSGNTSTTTGDDIRLSFWDGPPDDPSSSQIGATQVLSDIRGCGGYGIAEMTWPERMQGANVWYVKVEVEGETRLVASATALVAPWIQHLPVMFKAYSP
jgi:hypothetical protein